MILEKITPSTIKLKLNVEIMKSLPIGALALVNAFENCLELPSF